jgi:hypothetical protein
LTADQRIYFFAGLSNYIVLFKSWFSFIAKIIEIIFRPHAGQKHAVPTILKLDIEFRAELIKPACGICRLAVVMKW